METLAQYVQRLMDEKGLKAGGVAKRSNGGIGDSHVTNIITGTTTNLTVEKIKALALALEVDPVEIFRVAIGVDPELTIATVLRALEKLNEPGVSKLFLRIDQMNPKQIKALVEAAEKIK
jgi:hypothetical protein